MLVQIYRKLKPNLFCIRIIKRPLTSKRISYSCNVVKIWQKHRNKSIGYYEEDWKHHEKEISNHLVPTPCTLWATIIYQLLLLCYGLKVSTYVKLSQMISLGLGANLIVVPLGCFPRVALAAIWALEMVGNDTNPYCRASRLSIVSRMA